MRGMTGEESLDKRKRRRGVFGCLNRRVTLKRTRAFIVDRSFFFGSWSMKRMEDCLAFGWYHDEDVEGPKNEEKENDRRHVHAEGTPKVIKLCCHLSSR
jgi:hypothetical protein